MIKVSIGLAAVAAGVAASRPLLAGSGEPSPVRAAAVAPMASPGPVGELTVTSAGGAAKSGRVGGSKGEVMASGRSKYTDEQALTYFTSRWNDKTTKRVREIRTAGRYLRIYTDLPETADNSKSAITLCKRGLEYLKDIGETNPVVFVQAKFGGNGNPVLANILGPDDHTCRVTHPKPR
ncbi:hypothetical protein [Microtetraspora sp. NBRC 16547]|uniref:hypothetical protein n=1 Tax=Microtetraspora sp. NBRC 16547 TaxID=3030993 RepID=UPI0024A097BA|nr:hypothetical protein [Microtetraspora sp. NBRC 16547]GLW96649.1 hypothetical protein Misp02_07360 [Microtetraspora sp. NBRC 16547]